MRKFVRALPALYIGMTALISCEISDRELGQDILPPGDNVFLFHDTLFDIHAYPVTPSPALTSELRLASQSERIMLLGETTDTVVGHSEASIITQFNTNPQFRGGPNISIDSVMFFLRVADYIGDETQEITFRVHELTERIFIDSAYYSDFDPEGKYDPVPLVEGRFMPAEDTTLHFRIEDPEFVSKFLALEDTSLFRDDSLFKNYFNGLYITASSVAGPGAMARVIPNHVQTLLSVKYASDSTQVDSTAGDDYVWSQFSIEQYYTQKINIFKHDHSGTYLSGIIDQEEAVSPYCYVQGMAGVHTRFSLASLEEWMDKTPVAINSARLVFNVVPEEESGIPYDQIPDRLMINTLLENGEVEPVYDYWLMFTQLETNTSAFGGYKKAVSEGLFFDTTYNYRFNIGLHFQAMVDGQKKQNDFILKLSDEEYNPKISKLWSNLPALPERIRLEIVYLKLE